MDLNSHQQLFVITMEECGELIQECSKILRHGMNEKTHSKLIDEIGDVCAMIQLLKDDILTGLDPNPEKIEEVKAKTQKWFVDKRV